jgi:hypothetical protein
MRFERISEPIGLRRDTAPADTALRPDSLTFGRPRVRQHSRTARRRDVGRRALTGRDLAALRWIGEQYAVRLDVAGVLLSRLSPEPVGLLSRRTIRNQADRWEQAGWITRHRLLGHIWLTATAAGVRHAGLDHLEPWTPAAVRLAHHHAVALVRLAREPEPGGPAGCVSGSCGAAEAAPPGTWQTAPCPSRSHPVAAARCRRGVRADRGGVAPEDPPPRCRRPQDPPTRNPAGHLLHHPGPARRAVGAAELGGARARRHGACLRGVAAADPRHR